MRNEMKQTNTADIFVYPIANACVASSHDTLSKDI
jgi:hypothetical protein